MNLSVLGQKPTLEELAAMVGPAPSNSPTPAWERALVSLGQSLGGHINSTPFMQVADSGDWAGAGKTAADILMRDVLGRDPETGEQGLPGVGLAGMTVFHGSPHKWMPEPGFPQGRPRLDKLGTGEGAQVYGRGIYFAEEPDVAQQYAQVLSRKHGDAPDYWENIDLPANLSRTEADRKGQLGQKMRRATLTGAEMEEWRRLQSKHEAFQEALSDAEPRANVYSLDLPDEAVPRLLDWDASLISQPRAMQAAGQLVGERIPNSIGYYQDAGGNVRDVGGKTAGEFLRELVNERRNIGLKYGEVDSSHQKAVRQFINAGMDPAQGLRAAYSGISNIDVQNAVAHVQQDPQALAGHFAQSDIPGVKYFDQQSRNANAGTRNFVVWDQDWLDRMPILGVE